MKLFVDTSALLKFYYPEPDSARVEDTILSASTVYLSEVTLIEVASALAKKARMGEIDDRERMLIWNTFISDLSDTTIELQTLGSDTCRSASDLIIGHGTKNKLRTLDAIQLATALTLPNAKFLASDHALNRVAQLIGLRLAA